MRADCLKLYFYACKIDVTTPAHHHQKQQLKYWPLDRGSGDSVANRLENREKSRNYKRQPSFEGKSQRADLSNENRNFSDFKIPVGRPGYLAARPPATPPSEIPGHATVRRDRSVSVSLLRCITVIFDSNDKT